VWWTRLVKWRGTTVRAFVGIYIHERWEREREAVEVILITAAAEAIVNPVDRQIIVPSLYKSHRRPWMARHA
jgi:hypothetical protein